jgi:pimeloyl-ACP methyl ester carboxylesterase
MRALTATSSDGVRIAVQEWGNPAGPEILLIHGFNQSHRSWRRQFEDPVLAGRFRMVTYDLRGHGTSTRPAERAAYDPDRLWADDLGAVLDATGLKRPLAVAWSYGGRVLADYFRTHGTARMAAINYVNARASTEAALFGPAQVHLTGMRSDDLAVNAAATRGFLRACFHRQPDPEDFQAMMAFNMDVPAATRRHVLGRPDEDTEILASITCPVLVTHGRRDEIILPAMAEFLANTIPGAILTFYEDSGHAPFWEEPERFNAELAAFAGRHAGR